MNTPVRFKCGSQQIDKRSFYKTALERESGEYVGVSYSGNDCFLVTWQDGHQGIMSEYQLTNFVL